MRLLLLLLWFGCSETEVPEPVNTHPETTAPVSVDETSLVGIRWVPAGEDCYVPEPENPPPARFRDVFELGADGVFTTAVLAVDDGHYDATGTWRRTGAHLHVEAETRTKPYRQDWTVVSLERGTLCLGGRTTAME